MYLCVRGNQHGIAEPVAYLPVRWALVNKSVNSKLSGEARYLYEISHFRAYYVWYKLYQPLAVIVTTLFCSHSTQRQRSVTFTLLYGMGLNRFASRVDSQHRTCLTVNSSALLHWVK